MRHRSVEEHLAHLAALVERAERHTEGFSKEAFLEDEKTQDATDRVLQGMGNIVKELPQDLRDRHPNVAWAKIGGYRQRSAHDYFAVDFELVWAARQHLEPLKEMIRAEQIRATVIAQQERDIDKGRGR